MPGVGAARLDRGCESERTLHSGVGVSDTRHRQALPSGHDLQGYRLSEVLGVGGFGVTYLAWDTRLGQQVAIKEYLPNEFAVRDGTTVQPKSPNDESDFAWGLSRFLDEARTLARFRHPNLVRVLNYFEVNRTAYIVMDYEQGESLDSILKRKGRLGEAELRRLLLPIVDGLGQMHAAGYLHRDIKPSNVFVRRSNESPVLLDFGSARQALSTKSKSLTTVASAGYSPPEQYESDGDQGPWTDIYSLSALCYRAVTGRTPIEATRRMNRLMQSQPDPLPKLANERPAGCSRAFLVAVDQGLAPIPAERPSSLAAWAAAMEDGGANLSSAYGSSSSRTDSWSPPEGSAGTWFDSLRRRAWSAIVPETFETDGPDGVYGRPEVVAASGGNPACRIHGETGDGRAISVRIPGGLLAEGAVIGRSPRTSTFVIEDGTLSRRHARLFSESGVIYVEDLGSTNGTRVNGRALGAREPRAIYDGDRVELGAVAFQFGVDP